MKIKNFSYFRRAAASIALSFVISMSSVAGQFDALHQGIAQNTDTLIGNWQLFFPGLESQINAAFEEGRKTGNFIFHSNAAPVAWNVSENGTIAVNSINAGYFKSIRNPANHQLLFPGLSVDSQNVNISAGRDLIVTPVPVAEKRIWLCPKCRTGSDGQPQRSESNHSYDASKPGQLFLL